MSTIPATADPATARRRPPERVEGLFASAHDQIRDIDGLHADEALDELCKVLLAKLLDERSPRPRLRREVHRDPSALAGAARALHEEAEGPGASIRLSDPALARVVGVLESFDLGRSPSDLKGRAFQRVLAPAIRAGMGQYFTPEPVVELMVSVAGPAAGERVLDPFCGSARFLSAASRRSGGKARLLGIEKSDRMIRVAETGMRLLGDDPRWLRRGDALGPFDPADADFRPGAFDLILTNPPFGSKLGAEVAARLGPFDLARGRKAIPLEWLGLERSVQLLRPGGRLAIVVPDGLLANPAARAVRDWVGRRARLRAIVALPVETFAPFGACLKTSLLFLRTLRPGERIGPDDPVFLARVDRVGFDATGRADGASELPDVARELATFLDREGW